MISSAALTRENLFDMLYTSLERLPGDDGQQPVSLADWATQTPIVLDGRPFSFDRHEYLKVPTTIRRRLKST